MFKFIYIVHTRVRKHEFEKADLASVLHEVQNKAMVENQARFEWLKKAHLELQEKYTKSSDDISQMMEMLKMLTREKQSADIASLISVPTEDPLFRAAMRF